MKFHRVAFVALVACGGAAVSPQPQPLPVAGSTQPHRIHLHRESHVGDKLHVVAYADEDRVMTTRRGADVLETKHDVKKARMDAVATVLALDEKSEGLRVEYAVSTLTFSTGAKERSLLHEQRVEIVRGKKEEKTTITMGGEPVTAEIRDAMKLLVSMRSGGPTDDEIFGTSEPQSVGARWPINAKLAHDDLVADEGPEMQGTTVSGQAWLEAVAEKAGVSCLDVRSKIEIDGVDVPGKPEGSVLEAGRATASFEGMFPIDEKRGRVSDRLVLEMTIKLRVPTPSGEVLIELEGADHRDGQYTPL